MLQHTAPDGLVGFAGAAFFEDGFTHQFAGHLLIGGEVVGEGESAIVVDGGVDREVVSESQAVIFEAVTWSSMYGTGSCFSGHIIRQ